MKITHSHHSHTEYDDRPSPVIGLAEMARRAGEHVQHHTVSVRYRADHCELGIEDIRGWPAMMSGPTLTDARDAAQEMIAGQMAARDAYGRWVR